MLLTFVVTSSAVPAPNKDPSESTMMACSTPSEQTLLKNFVKALAFSIVSSDCLNAQQGLVKLNWLLSSALKIGTERKRKALMMI